MSTRKPLSICVAGPALVAQHLLQSRGAIDAQAIVLVGINDAALQFAFGQFRGLMAELVAG